MGPWVPAWPVGSRGEGLSIRYWSSRTAARRASTRVHWSAARCPARRSAPGLPEHGEGPGVHAHAIATRSGAQAAPPVAVASALPAEAAHTLLEGVRELANGGLQLRARCRALVDEVPDDLADFFCACSRVAASFIAVVA